MTKNVDAAAEENTPLQVRLVLDRANSSWIIGKMAQRLAENLPAWNVRVDVSEHPSPQADINHWMVYHYPWAYYTGGLAGRRTTKSTMLVTHLDDPIKLQMLRETLAEVVDVGICMSQMTVDELARRGIARDQLCFILPGHDGRVAPRRIVIGITSRVYSDGRKREHLLVELAETMTLDAFHFEIIGQGWEPIIPRLEAAGATVRYDAGTDDPRRDYEVLLQRIPTFDYYLYTGLDEGSMGTLDALAAGVATIITPQGFHLDLPGGITHPFQDGDQLRAVFANLAAQRDRRIDSVRSLTWPEYARQHAIVWRALRAGRQKDIPSLLPQRTGSDSLGPERSLAESVRSELRFYRNARTSHFLRPFVRRWFSRSKPRQRLQRVLSKLRKLLRGTGKSAALV